MNKLYLLLVFLLSTFMDIQGQVVAVKTNVLYGKPPDRDPLHHGRLILGAGQPLQCPPRSGGPGRAGGGRGGRRQGGGVPHGRDRPDRSAGRRQLVAAPG